MSAPHQRRARADGIVLDVSLAGATLRASLSAPNTSRAAVLTSASRDIALDAIRAVCDDVTAVLNRASRWGAMDRGSMGLLRQRGEILFDDLLPGDIKRSLRDTIEGPTTPRLSLVIDERLVFVPWELMHTGGAFLGLATSVGRVVRTSHAVVGRQRAEPVAPWRMLVLCDPRGDLIGSYYEGLTIRDELDVEQTRLAVDLRSAEVGVTDVKRVLRDYDIVHYAGHAEEHRDAPAESGWLLSDGVLSADALLELAGGRAFPRIVFSNACRSGHFSEDAFGAEASFGATYNLAQAFLLAGVHHYIGTIWDVPDEPASHFALEFYAALTAGAALGDATLRGRRALLERYGDDTVLWASYTLYGDPRVACFDAASAAAARPRRVASGPNDVRLNAPPPPSAQAGAAPRPGWRPRRSAARPRPGAAEPELGDGASSPRWTDRPGRLMALVTVAATALVGASLAVADREPGPRPSATLTDGPYVAEIGVARVPAPRPTPPRSPVTTPPASGADDRAEVVVDMRHALELAIVSADADDGSGTIAVPDGGALESGDNFRVRFRLDAPGWVAVYHVESQGNLRRIHPSEAPHRRVDHLGWVDLPAADAWYFLDERKGVERFILAHALEGPDADPAFNAALDEIEAGLLAHHATRAQTRAERRAPTLNLRGLGGTRPDPARGEGEDAEVALLARLARALEARYDRLQMVEIRHR